MLPAMAWGDLAGLKDPGGLDVYLSGSWWLSAQRVLLALLKLKLGQEVLGRKSN